MPLNAILLALALSAAPTTGELATDLPRTFLPEGLEWDAKHARFLIAGVHARRIAAVDPRSGHATVFASVPGSPLGLHIDARTGIVYAAWTRFGHAFEHNPAIGISAWSTDSGRHLGDWPLPEADPRGNLGDLAIVDARTVVASDSGTGAIWRFDTRTHRYANVVPAGRFKNPQGLAPGRAPGTVYLADYPTGLWRVALKDGTAIPLQAPAGAELRGIDGLYRRGDELIGVQNGTKTPRILRISLEAGDRIAGVRRWHEMPGTEPTLGTLAGDAFWFIANGQWSLHDDDLEPKAGAALQAPVLRGLPFAHSSGHE